MRQLLFFSALFISQFAAPVVQAQTGCTTQSLQLAQQQLGKTLGYITTSQFPQLTVPPPNHWNAGLATDWTSGFFPGWLWYMYEQTLDNSLLSRAQAQTAALAGETTDATDLNVGFRIMGSYGNGYSVTRDPSYMKAIQTGANTMASLYVSSAGVINSVPTYNPSKINVIIDNMPALEILFYAAQNGGNPAWYNMAVSHALKTMQNNVRADGSTYQGVEYNQDGSVYIRFAWDGATVNSTWSRGQAWGLYGFTMTYRYTQDPSFLATAQKLADYFIGNLPPDYVPVWDFSKPWTDPRDSSAAAIAAASLLELSTYMTDPSLQSKYYNAALNIQTSLSNPALYLANPSPNSPTDGILLHGTYSKPFNAGVDTSLIWGDYYFIQGCYRAMNRPAQVTNVSATAPASNQVALTWNAQSGAIRYTVKRSATAGGPYGIIAPPPILTASTFTDTTAVPSATYYYVVSASSVAGEGPNSAEVAVTTPARTPTAAALVSSLNPSIYGQPVTFTATITSTAGTPTGTVTFKDGAATLGTGTLNTGKATYLTSNLSAGSHSITAVYAGDTNFTGSSSSAITQTVNPPAGPLSFLTGYALNSPPLRSDFSGFVGMKFTVGANALTVNSLGRIFITGNTGTHTVKLVQAANGADVPGGSVSVSMTGGVAGQFKYVSLGNAVTLQANTAYYLVSQEAGGGDQWYDTGNVSSTNVAAVNSSIYSFNGSGNWNSFSTANTSYVPANFQYALASLNPDLTIVKSHSGSFTQGDTGDTYSLTVTNSGGAATSGTVTVTDTVPAGLTPTAMSGTGWTCTQPSGPCTRSDAQRQRQLSADYAHGECGRQCALQRDQHGHRSGRR